MRRIGSHAQYDFGSLDRREASSARGDRALKLSPGGSMSPFCEPPTDTSTPQSSCR